MKFFIKKLCVVIFLVGGSPAFVVAEDIKNLIPKAKTEKDWMRILDLKEKFNRDRDFILLWNHAGYLEGATYELNPHPQTTEAERKRFKAEKEVFKKALIKHGREHLYRNGGVRGWTLIKSVNGLNELFDDIENESGSKRSTPFLRAWRQAEAREMKIRNDIEMKRIKQKKLERAIADGEVNLKAEAAALKDEVTRKDYQQLLIPAEYESKWARWQWSAEVNLEEKKAGLAEAEEDVRKQTKLLKKIEKAGTGGEEHTRIMGALFTAERKLREAKIELDKAIRRKASTIIRIKKDKHRRNDVPGHYPWLGKGEKAVAEGRASSVDDWHIKGWDAEQKKKPKIIKKVWIEDELDEFSIFHGGILADGKRERPLTEAELRQRDLWLEEGPLKAIRAIKLEKANKETIMNNDDRETEATGMVGLPATGMGGAGTPLTENTNCDNPFLPPSRRCDSVSSSKKTRSSGTSGVR